MNNLLAILLSFYPAIFLYSIIPATYIKKIDALSSAPTVLFAIHLVVLAFIFFVIHTSFKRLVSFGYLSGTKRGFVGISIMTIFIALVDIIVFYIVLPGATLYHAPVFIQKYLLTEPYTLIAYFLPFVYLFF
ncbi:MAG: hypothetical protein WC629_02055 [Candidatus Paceibacterota bacterium]|jgi:hypothetical protein